MVERVFQHPARDADFDYRGKLRDQVWVQRLAKEVVGTCVKMVQRGRLDSFTAEWERGYAQ